MWNFWLKVEKIEKKYQKLNVKFLTQSGKTFLKVTVNS
jgi:hypothetical protein